MYALPFYGVSCVIYCRKPESDIASGRTRLPFGNVLLPHFRPPFLLNAPHATRLKARCNYWQIRLLLVLRRIAFFICTAYAVHLLGVLRVYPAKPFGFYGSQKSFESCRLFQGITFFTFRKNHTKANFFLRPAGLEPATTRFEVWYSIHVSYERCKLLGWMTGFVFQPSASKF